jgi:hypothetical protein
MKCQIQWIDKAGKPTPDDNEAVCFAVFTAIDATTRSDRKFPCCAKHAQELEELEANGWNFSTITSTKTCWTREEL